MLKRFRKVEFIMKLICPECGSEKFARSIGEVSCRKCGLIIDENMMM